jgi:hypothetical protein
MRHTTTLLVFALLSAGPAGACVKVGYDHTLPSSWVTSIATSQRGPLDIANPGLGFPTHGEAIDVVGSASAISTDVFSLGDGGSLTASLASEIWDGPGDDFAVYENGFFNLEGLFAEFAYVEVSSDGVLFARFDSDTTNTVSVPSFGSVDPCAYNGLAGDTPNAEGTGFDLADLSGHLLATSGQLDLLHVTHVRVIDVVGDGSTVDSGGLPIYDPYATAFSTGGFDLHAIGALHAPEPGFHLSLVVGCVALAFLSRRRAHSGHACSGAR